MTPKEKLWVLTYQTFQDRLIESLNASAAGEKVPYELETRLMQNITTVREDKGPVNRRLVGSIVTDILLGESMGWITPEVSKAMQDLIDDILDGK